MKFDYPVIVNAETGKVLEGQSTLYHALLACARVNAQEFKYGRAGDLYYVRLPNGRDIKVEISETHRHSHQDATT